MKENIQGCQVKKNSSQKKESPILTAEMDPNPKKQKQDHDNRLCGRHRKGAGVFILKIGWIS